MPYLIDGHNLIAHMPSINIQDENDEAKLVQKLAGFCAREKTRCTVVFDAGLPAGFSRMSNSAVKVVFAPYSSNADSVIKKRITGEHNREQTTVVSSDNEVLEVARRFKMMTMKASEFAKKLENPIPPKPDLGESVEIRLSSKEVDEWMNLFSDDGSGSSRKQGRKA